MAGGRSTGPSAGHRSVEPLTEPRGVVRNMGEPRGLIQQVYLPRASGTFVWLLPPRTGFLILLSVCSFK